ncbi:hypothetical protein B6I21_00810 [candidate division KSB1 bacterium 4572_119]|nr:MAG: hypothetical protein B6I21_00810 [candidate division KSB1 bacterium 4572_119]
MAIMNKMRENTHVILFILLVLFVLSMTIGGLVGGADITSILSGHKPDMVLSVNDEDISYDQYSNIRQQQFENFRQQKQKEPAGYELQQLEDQIFESVVRDVLIKQLIDKMGIAVSRNEIKFHIFENPPEFLRSNPNFADSTGKFDIQKYQAALSDNRNNNYWLMVENYLAGSLPFEKIHQEVLSSVFVTDQEVREDFIKRNQKAKVKYLFFDPNSYKIEDAEITEKEIENYYKKNKEEYHEGEKRKIQYLLFELKPSESDTNEIKEFAFSLLDSIKQGVNFGDLAKNYSDDGGSAVNGGDLGFFEKGMMVKPFEEASFTAKKGDVVGPVLTQHGFHIIKIEDKKVEDGKEKVKARHILLNIKPSRNTIETVRDDANYFAEVAAEEGFSQAVINEHLAPDTTIFFSRSGFLPGLGMQKRISDAVFNAKVGKASRVYYIEDRGYLIYEVTEIQKEGTKPLAEVEAMIKNTIRREKQIELAGADCRKFREKITSPESFETLAAQDSLKIEETDFFAMSGFIRGVGKDTKFIGTAFGLSQDEISGPVKGTRGYYLIKLVEKQEINESLFDLQKNALKIDLLDNKRQTAYSNWYNDLKEKAEIIDNRYKFF